MFYVLLNSAIYLYLVFSVNLIDRFSFSFCKSKSFFDSSSIYFSCFFLAFLNEVSAIYFFACSYFTPFSVYSRPSKVNWLVIIYLTVAGAIFFILVRLTLWSSFPFSFLFSLNCSKVIIFSPFYLHLAKYFSSISFNANFFF